MRYKNIQIARAIAANAVLLSHLQIVEQKDNHGLALLPAWFHFGSGGVDLFFVLSGFIMVLIAPRENWSEFLIARATRIFPPYWFYSLAVLAVALIAPGIVNNSFDHAPSLWRSFFLVPDSVDPLLAVGWTLTHEAYFYVVFAVILFSRRAQFPLLCAWGAILIIARFLLAEPPTQEASPVLANLLHPLTFEFIGGAFVGLLIRSNVTKFALLSFGLGFIALLGFLFTTDDALRLFHAQDNGWERLVRMGVPFMFIVYGLAGMEKQQPEKSGKSLLERLGDASYSTYLTHVLVLSAIGRIFVALPFKGVAPEALFLTVCVIASNVLGLASFAWLEKPTLKFFRKFRRRAI